MVYAFTTITAFKSRILSLFYFIHKEWVVYFTQILFYFLLNQLGVVQEVLVYLDRLVYSLCRGTQTPSSCTNMQLLDMQALSRTAKDKLTAALDC